MFEENVSLTESIIRKSREREQLPLAWLKAQPKYGQITATVLFKMIFELESLIHFSTGKKNDCEEKQVTIIIYFRKERQWFMKTYTSDQFDRNYVNICLLSS